MALQNPSTLYTGGNVVLDSSPVVDYYSQLQFKKQARDEALNKYFTGLADNINTAGVRMKDLAGPLGGVDNDIKAWQKHWMDNKDAIKKGGVAQQQHLSMLNNIQRRIGQSKEAAKKELEIGKAKFEGKYDPDDDDIKVLEKIGKSIYDPEYYKEDGISEYGWGDLSLSVPDFDTKKQNEFWLAASRGVKPGRVFDEANMRLDKTTGKAFVPFKEVYSPDQIKKFADDGVDLVKGDRSARKYYNKILDNPTSDQWKRLNEAYQGVYGKNSIVSTPEQAAQADLILKGSGVFDAGEQLVTDQNASHQRALEKLLYNSNLIASRALSKDNTTGTTINDVFSEIDNSSQLRDRVARDKGVPLNELSSQAQQVVLKMVNEIATNTEPDLNDPKKTRKVPFFQEDIYIQKDADGKVRVKGAKGTYLDKPIVTLDQTSVNLKTQPSVKEKREVVKMGKTGVQRPQQTFNIINPKTGEVVMPNVTQEQADKAKAKGYKVQ